MAVAGHEGAGVVEHAGRPRPTRPPGRTAWWPRSATASATKAAAIFASYVALGAVVEQAPGGLHGRRGVGQVVDDDLVGVAGRRASELLGPASRTTPAATSMTDATSWRSTLVMASEVTGAAGSVLPLAPAMRPPVPRTSGPPARLVRWSGPSTTGVPTTSTSDGAASRRAARRRGPRPLPSAQNIHDLADHPVRVRRPAVRRGFLDEVGSGRRGRRRPGARGGSPSSRSPGTTPSTWWPPSWNGSGTEHGNESIFAGSYGWASAGRFHNAQTQLYRFLNLIGGFTRSVNSYSYAAAEVILPHVVGAFFGVLGEPHLLRATRPARPARGRLRRPAVQEPAGRERRVPTVTRPRGRCAPWPRPASASSTCPRQRSDVDAELGRDLVADPPGTDTALMLALGPHAGGRGPATTPSSWTATAQASEQFTGLARAVGRRRGRRGSAGSPSGTIRRAGPGPGGGTVAASPRRGPCNGPSTASMPTGR